MIRKNELPARRDPPARPLIADPERYIETLCEALRGVEPQAIIRIAELLVETARRGSTIYLAGNGGSALTASHYHVDLIAAFSDRRERTMVINLVHSPGLLTALGNDHAFECTLSLQVEASGRDGDLLVAVSASGDSPNILAACRSAKARGLIVVGVTGFGGGALAREADLGITVPACNYGVVEDAHLAIGHMLSQTIRRL